MASSTQGYGDVVWSEVADFYWTGLTVLAAENTAMRLGQAAADWIR